MGTEDEMMVLKEVVIAIVDVLNRGEDDMVEILEELCIVVRVGLVPMFVDTVPDAELTISLDIIV